MSLVDYASSSDEEEEDTEPSRLLLEENNDDDKNHQNIQSAPAGSQPPPRRPSDHLPPPPPPQTAQSPPPPAASPRHQSRVSTSSVNGKTEPASHLASPSIEKLPDASVLLNLPMSSQPVNFTDHASRVAAAYSQNALGKREGNGSISSYTRSKIPRGNLPHLKSIPETGGSQLVPPQLRGRSNVVTDDIGSLFVRRKGDRSHTGD